MSGIETILPLYLQGEAHQQLLQLKESIGATGVIIYLPNGQEFVPFWSENASTIIKLPVPEHINKLSSVIEKAWGENMQFRSLSFDYQGGFGAVVFICDNNITEAQDKTLKNQRPKVGQALSVAFDYIHLFKKWSDTQPQNDVTKKITASENTNLTEVSENEKNTLYAGRIQKAIMRSPVLLERTFSEVGLFYRPCDPVRGDFYWFQVKNDDLYLAVADCTGQGIAGVFMSVLAKDLLSGILEETSLETPADILTELHARMIHVLTDNDPNHELEDGLDIALCRINRISLVIQYAGANLPFIFWNGKDLLEFRSARQAIAKNFITAEIKDEAFTNQEVYAKTGDAIFLMTDGISDQFGDDWSKKLTKKRLLDFIRENRSHDLGTLPTRTDLFLNDFRGKTPQTDDYLLIGVRF